MVGSLGVPCYDIVIVLGRSMVYTQTLLKLFRPLFSPPMNRGISHCIFAAACCVAGFVRVSSLQDFLNLCTEKQNRKEELGHARVWSFGVLLVLSCAAVKCHHSRLPHKEKDTSALGFCEEEEAASHQGSGVICLEADLVSW